MLDNLGYGPHGYSAHEESFAVENEYHSNHYGSMQMMPPAHHSKQHMSYTSGTPGSDGWHGHGLGHGHGHGHGKINKYSYGRQASEAQAGWSSPNGHGYYNHGPAGAKLHGMHGSGGRMPSNNTMTSAQFETYHAAPGRMGMYNYGMHAESYSDTANGMHGGRQEVEWKAL